MASSDGDGDPEWRLEGVSWDADTMQASTKDTSSGGLGGPSATGRSPNTSCQVEGCPAYLPLRTYYQRQHICEEHFRAVTITEPSGRVMRFCQQCTKLEPLDNFDGERRSCRESLLRRNKRRQGRRTGSRKARPAKKAAPAHGSEDSTTRVQRTSSPSGATAASPAEQRGSAQRAKRQRREPAPSPPPVTAGYWLQPEGGSGSEAGSGCSPGGLPPHLLGAIEQLEALEPALTDPPLVAALHPSQALQQGGHAAGHSWQVMPGGAPGAGAARVALTGMGPAQLGTLASTDIDQLLAIDSDQLADLLLAGSRMCPSAPAAAASTGTSSAAASHAGWALPALAPQQQVLYTLPAVAAPQLNQLQAAGLAAAPLPSDHSWPQHASGHAAPQRPPAYAAPHAQQPGASMPGGAAATNGRAGASATTDVAAFAATFFGDWPAASPDDAELELLLDCFEPLYEEVRLSLKLYGVHPDQLPTTLRAELLNALAVHPTPAQAAIRSGCVHLTLTALIDAEERRRLLAPGAAATVLARLLMLVERLPARRAALQLAQGSCGSAALLATPPSRTGGPAALLSLQLSQSGASPVPPALEVQAPLATTVSACRGFFHMRCPRGLLWGADRLMAVCRRAGTGHLPLSLTLAGQQGSKQPPPGAAADEGEEGWPASDDGELSDGEEAAAAGAECDPEELVDVEAWVPFQPPPVEERGSDTAIWQAGWGLYEFELARGALVGPAMPVLVLPDAHAAAAAELARLPPGAKGATLLRLAALVLRYLEQREGATGPQAAAAFEARYPPLAVARLAAAARQLLDLAKRAGWEAVAALVQPAAIADGWHPARAALMAAPRPAAVPRAPAVAGPPAAPAAAQRAATLPPPAADPAAAQPVAALEQEAVHVVGTLLPALPPPAQPPAQALASGSADSPRKPGTSSTSPWGGKAGAGASKELEAQLAELSEGDSLRRVMHPAVLCAATAVVASCVLGVGWALGAGYL